MQNNMKNGQTFPSELLNCLNKLYKHFSKIKLVVLLVLDWPRQMYLMNTC